MKMAIFQYTLFLLPFELEGRNGKTKHIVSLQLEVYTQRNILNLSFWKNIYCDFK